MIVSDTEKRIILRISQICINDFDECYIGLLYDITAKNYLWKTINKLIDLEILSCSRVGRKKYVSFTSKGLTLAYALYTIEKL